MKSMDRAAVGLLVVLLGGCAIGGWTRPNTSRDQLDEDRNQCGLEAGRKYPVVMASTNFDANAIPRSNAVDACLRNKGYVFKIGG
jgi:hypothetical protein